LEFPALFFDSCTILKEFRATPLFLPSTFGKLLRFQRYAPNGFLYWVILLVFLFFGSRYLSLFFDSCSILKELRATPLFLLGFSDDQPMLKRHPDIHRKGINVVCLFLGLKVQLLECIVLKKVDTFLV
jgi:hypothetical protein